MRIHSAISSSFSIDTVIVSMATVRCMFALLLSVVTLINVIDAKYEALQRYIVGDGSGSTSPADNHSKVIQPWPQAKDHDRQMEPVSRGFLRLLMKEMHTIIGRLAHRIDSYTLILYHLYRYVRSMDEDITCVRYCQPVTCQSGIMSMDLRLEVPCMAMCVVNHWNFHCSFTIQPFYDLQWNVTFEHFHTSPICDLNYITIDDSEPFCGSYGGLITSSQAPIIDINMGNNDVYDPESRGYIARDTNLLIYISAYNPVNSHEQLVWADLQSIGPFHELIQLTERRNVSNFLFYYKTAPYNTGCAAISTNCRNNTDEYFVSLTRGAPEFRHRAEAVMAEGWLLCDENSTGGFHVAACAEIGDLTLQLKSRAIQYNIDIASVNFFQTDINRTSKYVAYDIEQDTLVSPDMVFNIYAHPKHRYFHQSYIKARFYIPDTTDKNLVLMVVINSGIYIPHRDCGAGGLYILTEYTDWDLGPFCGGYATNHLATLNDLIPMNWVSRTNITLGKEITFIFKAYFLDFGMDITFGFSLAECKGVVNPIFPSPNSNTSQNDRKPEEMENVIQWEPGTCLDITFMDSDTGPHPSTMLSVVSTTNTTIPLQAIVHMNNPLLSGMYQFDLDQPNEALIVVFHPDHTKLVRVERLSPCVNIISYTKFMVHYKSDFFKPYLGESLRIMVARA